MMLKQSRSFMKREVAGQIGAETVVTLFGSSFADGYLW